MRADAHFCFCDDQATLYKMAQRVLAENAGVMSVRYVLPNKHYIPVDMKYIGVDNTTPYVAISLWHCVVWNLVFEGLILFGKCHLPRVVEQKMMGCDGGGFFSRSMPFSLVVCHPSSATLECLVN